MREESRRTPLPELLNTVVQSSGLEMVFAALPDGERRRGSLAAFASFVTAGAQTELRSLSELVQLLLQMQQRGARLPAQDAPARSDAVRIMSIHKSKGLEFPIVILADLARKMNMQDNAAAVLTDEELLIGGNVVDLASRSYYHGLARRAIIDRKTAQTVSEELRVLYVAMTRARNELAVFTFPPEKTSSAFSQFLFRPKRRIPRKSKKKTAADSFLPGTPVQHSAYGAGRILAREGDRVRIRFSGGSERVFSLAAAVPNGLLSLRQESGGNAAKAD